MDRYLQLQEDQNLRTDSGTGHLAAFSDRYRGGSGDSALRNLIPAPPLTIILDVDYKTARERLKTTEFGTPDRYEMVDEVVWNRRRTAYESLPYKYKHRLFLTIPTHMYSFEEVVKQCERKIKILLGEDTRDDA